MPRWWLAVGPQSNWEAAFTLGNIWGMKASGRPQVMWDTLTEGDRVIFYVTTPIAGSIGYGVVRRKFRQDRPLWPDEVKSRTVRWPLRFEFDPVYLLPPENWAEGKVSSEKLRILARGGFQALEDDMALGIVQNLGGPGFVGVDEGPVPSTHAQIIEGLLEAGQLQRFLVDKEYRMDGERLDVVWRRVERSVPTYVFEVQVGGDLYHALGKLKHSYDIWNSRIFLVASEADRARVQTLLRGTFHEISSELRFIRVEAFQRLLALKRELRDLERELGLL